MCIFICLFISGPQCKLLGLPVIVQANKVFLFQCSFPWGAGMAQWLSICLPRRPPGLGAICGLSLLLVLVLAPRGFSPGTPVFPSPQKPTFLNSNSIWNPRATGSVVRLFRFFSEILVMRDVD